MGHETDPCGDPFTDVTRIRSESAQHGAKIFNFVLYSTENISPYPLPEYQEGENQNSFTNMNECFGLVLPTKALYCLYHGVDNGKPRGKPQSF